MNINAIPIVKMDGTTTSLADYHGKVILVVNVASRCGLAPQYATLETLHRTYKDRGFTVLGFPAIISCGNWAATRRLRNSAPPLTG